MPNCKHCGHAAADHSFQRTAYLECRKCDCRRWEPNAYVPKGRRFPLRPVPVDNPVLRRFIRRKRTK